MQAISSQERSCPPPCQAELSNERADPSDPEQRESLERTCHFGAKIALRGSCAHGTGNFALNQRGHAINRVAVRFTRDHPLTVMLFNSDTVSPPKANSVIRS